MDTPYCLATSPKHVGFSHVPKWLFPTFSFPLMPSTLADHLCRYFTKETTGDTEGLLIFLQQYWIICQHLDAHLPQSLTLPPVKDQTLHHFCSCLSQPYLPHDFILLSFPLWDYFFFYVIPITSPIKKMKTKNLPLHINTFSAALFPNVVTTSSVCFHFQLSSLRQLLLRLFWSRAASVHIMLTNSKVTIF